MAFVVSVLNILCEGNFFWAVAELGIWSACTAFLEETKYNCQIGPNFIKNEWRC